MKPFLVEWVFQGHLIRVPSFGFFLASAFSFAYFWSLRNARTIKIEGKHIERVFLLILVSSILGGRLFHVVFEEPRFYLNHLSKIPAVWEGGFTFYGAMLASTAAIFLYSKYYRINLGSLMDIVATSTLMSICIGRVGCFLAGCCWGKVCKLPWSITVHPAQLYESFGALVLFIFCQSQFKSRRFPGEIGLKALMGYSLLRFFVEYFRGDSYRGFILDGMLSYSQAISIALGSGAFLVFLSIKRKHAL